MSMSRKGKMSVVEIMFNVATQIKKKLGLKEQL